MPRVVVVEPPSPDRRRREDLLRTAGHEVLAADDARSARPALAAADAVVLDDPGLLDAARLAGCVPVAPCDALAEAVARALADEDFDEASLQRMRDQFQGTFGSFVGLFLREAHKRVASLQEALARRDAATVGREAHTLKPTSGMLGARRLSLRCAGVEALCRDGWDDDLPALCGDLLDDLSRLRRRLEPMAHD